MAKQKVDTNKEKTVNFPSGYGSHASMMDKDQTEFVSNRYLEDYKFEDEVEKEALEQKVRERYVVLKDSDGLYLTERCRLDNGLADSNRWATPEVRNQKLAAFGIKVETQE